VTLAAEMRAARKIILARAVAEAEGNLSLAARRLGVHRNTLGRLCVECGVDYPAHLGGARRGVEYRRNRTAMREEEYKTTAIRRRLPEVRVGTTHKFIIAGHRGYVTVNCYEDGAPGEVFLRMDKVGSATRGWTDAFSIAFSMLLQQGTPLRQLVEKFRATRFEPAGVTGSPEIGLAASALDYVMRWMELRYLKK
jgi:ribonucleoside-diphosphate reductase alpha chain